MPLEFVCATCICNWHIKAFAFPLLNMLYDVSTCTHVLWSSSIRHSILWLYHFNTWFVSSTLHCWLLVWQYGSKLRERGLIKRSQCHPGSTKAWSDLCEQVGPIFVTFTMWQYGYKSLERELIKRFRCHPESTKAWPGFVWFVWQGWAQ